MLLRAARGRLRRGSPRASAEGEHVAGDAGVEELDLEGAWTDRFPLAHQLVHARLVEDAATGGLDVEAAVLAGRLAVEPDHESRRGAVSRGSEHEVEVAAAE